MKRLVLLLPWFGAWGCGSDEICTASDLEANLGSSNAGDTVTIGDCRIDGAFVVPSGVALRGSAAGSTIVSSGVALELTGNATVEQLGIESERHAIIGMSAGTVVLRSLQISALHGGAIVGFEGTTSLTLEDVDLDGPIDASNAGQVPDPPTPMDSALYGIVLVDVDDARFDRVTANGFALAGVVSSDSRLTWNTGDASSNLGLGIWIDGGSATLEEITVRETLRGFRGVPSFALATGRSASVETSGVELSLTDGFGALHDTGSVTHRALRADGNTAGGVFAQRTSSFTVNGGSQLADNEFGGIMAIEAGGLVIEDTTVRGTRAVVRVMGEWGSIMVGDGLQLVAPVAGSLVRGIELDGNERAGVLVDLSGGDSSLVVLADVTATAGGAAFGCVAQNGVVADEWDDDVARGGAAATNDPSFAGGLEVVGLVAPAEMPDPVNLVGVIGPCN